MTKLLIMIPCYNEEQTLPMTVAELPRTIPGIDTVEWLIVDDGCTDNTVQVAEALGVDHIIRHVGNKGLAAAFRTGITSCLELGADIIVNTDGDNQYPGRYIPALVQPILTNAADMVISDRQINTIEHFSPFKKALQVLGSSVVQYVSGTDVPDAPSGFRAYSRDAALQINIMTGFSHSVETIVQAGKKGLTIATVPITTNPKTRESRLMRNMAHFIRRQGVTILRLFLLYEPLRTFSLISIPFWLVGLGLWIRYGILLIAGETSRGSNVQSVIVGSVSLIIAFLIFLLGLIGDIVAINRRLTEETLYYVKRLALKKEEKGDSRGQGD